MATMNRVYSLYKDSYESSLEKLYERGLIFMTSCRRKATRNIVRVTEVHQEQVDQSEQIENMFSNPLTLYEASGLLFCASSDENAMLASAFEEHRGNERTKFSNLQSWRGWYSIGLEKRHSESTSGEAGIRTGIRLRRRKTCGFGLRSAPVGAKPMSPGHRAPHLVYCSMYWKGKQQWTFQRLKEK